MKHLFHHAMKAHTLRRRIAMSAGLFLSVFGMSAGGAYMLMPQTVIRENDNSSNSGGIIEDHKMTGRERFISNLANAASNGMSITADKLLFEFDGKQEQIVNGDNAPEIINHVNRIDASGTTIDLALSSISLHGINLALTAPISYSDAGNRVHKRGLHASMIDSQIYLNLFDQEGDEINKNWDFKYKVDARAYDSPLGGNEANIDPITGGILQYEYGYLDWLVEDVFAILSEGGIDLSLQGWLDNLLSSSTETEEAPIPTDTQAEEEPAASGISTDDIMASMDQMIETTFEGNPYFIWNLPLGNMNIELGMRANADFQFSGVDLPARFDYQETEDGTGYDFTEKENPFWTIQEGMRLSVQATVEEFETGHVEGWKASALVPGDVEQYRDLYNSRHLLESIAKYVAHPQFGVDVALDLGYATSAKAGDRTHVKKDAKSDSMRLALSADADLEGRKFHGVNAKLSLEKMGLNDNDELVRQAGHDINVSYLYDQQNKQGDGYLDINGEFFKAHTTKVYLDEFYAEVLKDAFSGDSTEEKAEGSNTLNQIQEVLDKLGISLDTILHSDFLTDFQNGVYVSAVDFIKSIVNSDDQIVVTLSLAPLGLEGEIVLTLTGSTNVHDLLDIRFSGIKFAAFTLDGSISTRAFAALPTVASYADKGYDDLSHLKGIGEQVTEIVHEKAFKANLGVALSEADEEKLSVDGGLAFAFTDDTKQGKVDLRLHQGLTDKIVPEHRIAIDMLDQYKSVAFSYGSGNSQEALDAMPEDALKGQLGFDTFTSATEETPSLLARLFNNVSSMDDRFSRLTASLAKEGGSSLLSRITSGEISALLEGHILKSADLHDENGNTAIIVDGAALGMENDIAVTMSYGANSEDAEGRLEALSLGMKLGEKDLTVTLDGIEAVAAEDNAASFHNFDSTEGFKDLGFIGDLAEYAVGSLTLGTTAAKDEDGNKIVSGISYYGLEGNLAVAIGSHTLKLGLFDAYASVEGAETKIYADLAGIPVIRGVNGPDSDIYFRPNEAEGVRESAIYYYANGIDPKGQALLTRDSSYGKVRNVRDAVRLDGEQFTGDLLGWLGRYSLGIVDSLLDGTDVQASPKNAKRLSRAGILGDEALRIETVFNGFNKTSADGKDTFTLSVDLGALLGIPVLGNADINIYGQNVQFGDNSFKTLTGINIHADGSVKGKTNSMKLASVDVDLFLNNIKNGTMENVWEYEANAAYAQNFVRTVNDAGEIVEAGLFYDLGNGGNGFTNPDQKPTQIYGYNYVGVNAAKAGNHYIGL